MREITLTKFFLWVLTMKKCCWQDYLEMKKIMLLLGPNRSLPLRDMRPSETTVKVDESEVHPLLLIGDCNFSSMWLGSFENLPSCGRTLSWIQKESGLLFNICDASDRLRILHALPESTRSVVEMLPILIGILRGSIFALSFSKRATVFPPRCCSQTRRGRSSRSTNSQIRWWVFSFT